MQAFLVKKIIWNGVMPKRDYFTQLFTEKIYNYWL